MSSIFHRVRSLFRVEGQIASIPPDIAPSTSATTLHSPGEAFGAEAESPVTATALPRFRQLAPPLDGLYELHRAIGRPATEIQAVFSRRSQLIFPMSFAILVTEARAAVANGESLLQRSRRLGQSHHTTWREGTRALLEQNTFAEQYVRSVTWALGCRSVHTATMVSLPSVTEATARELSIGMARRRSRLLWWTSGAQVPLLLLRQAEQDGYYILGDSSTASPSPSDSSHYVADVNPPIVERIPEAFGGELRLFGSAATIQVVRRDERAAWHRITPPKGFLRLERDITLSELKELRLRTQVAMMKERGGDDAVLAIADPPLRAVPNTGSRPALAVSYSQQLNKEEFMESSGASSGGVVITYPEEAPGRDRMPLGNVCFVAPFTGGGRGPADVTFDEMKSDDVATAATQHGVRITGFVIDHDGQKVPVDEQVQDEGSFDKDGMTRLVDVLFKNYVYAYTYEKCAAYLSSHDRDHLTPEEVTELENAEKLLRQANEEDAA